MENQEFKTVGQFIAHVKENLGEFTTEQVVETIEEILSRPVQPAVRRGQLAGLTLEEMTDEQLKREIVNAKSVLYKAQQRNADPATIEKNQARVDAALAEKAKRTPEAPATTEETTEEAPATEGSDSVFTEGLEEEI